MRGVISYVLTLALLLVRSGPVLTHPFSTRTTNPLFLSFCPALPFVPTRNEKPEHFSDLLTSLWGLSLHSSPGIHRRGFMQP